MNKNQKTRRSRGFAWMIGSGLLLSAAALLTTSCADTFDSKETFDVGVRNATLESPNEADVKITPSTDGSTMSIEWPVVYGAGGYEFKLLNSSDETKPIVADTIDGCKRTVPREEDMNYKIVIRTLGNAKLNNTEASKATEKAYSTFTESDGKIPAGTDLFKFFTENNPIGSDVAISKELNFDLEPGAKYTLSKPLNFNYHKIVLRTSDKANRATITLADSANFIISNDFTLKYINLDASACVLPTLEAYKYSEEPPTDIIPKPKNYLMIDFVRLIGCDIKGVIGSLFFDNNKSWAVVNFLIKNSIIEMNTDTKSIKNESFISFQGGGIKNFQIESSTVHQIGNGNSKYFIRYNNSVRVDRMGYETSDHTTLTYTNNTFYRVASGQWANYSGISNYSAYNIQNNIWVDCADGNIARRIMGNGRLGNNCTAIWSNNTYWKDGAAVDQGTYDTGTILTTDPAFTDPANKSFRPTGAQQVEKKTGDQRWYEAN